MVNKKKRNISIIIGIIILILYLANQPKGLEDIQITAKFYDQDGNLVGQQRAFKKPVIPTMSFTCVGDTFTSDAVVELDSSIVSDVEFSIDLTNTGSLPVNASYVIESEPSQDVGEARVGESIPQFSTTPYDITSSPFNTESQLNLVISGDFAGKLQKQITYVWRFKRIILCNSNTCSGSRKETDEFGCDIWSYTPVLDVVGKNSADDFLCHYCYYEGCTNNGGTGIGGWVAWKCIVIYGSEITCGGSILECKSNTCNGDYIETDENGCDVWSSQEVVAVISNGNGEATNEECNYCYFQGCTDNGGTGIGSFVEAYCELVYDEVTCGGI